MQQTTERVVAASGGLRLLEKHYPAHLRMPPHAHGTWRFCLAIRGEYTDSWRRGYRRRGPSQLSLHPAEETHTTVFHSDAACFHIEFADSWRERLLGDAGIAPEPHEFLDGRVPQIAIEMRGEAMHADPGTALVLEGLACELIGWTARALRRKAAGAPWLARARELLHDRFAETLTLEEIAKAVGVHPVHLARQFRRSYGCTVGAYVRQLRVDFARRALASSAPLSDIALTAGFADQSHFSRVFKHETGLTPGEFRRRR